MKDTNYDRSYDRNLNRRISKFTVTANGETRQFDETPDVRFIHINENHGDHDHDWVIAVGRDGKEIERFAEGFVVHIAWKAEETPKMFTPADPQP